MTYTKILLPFLAGLFVSSASCQSTPVLLQNNDRTITVPEGTNQATFNGHHFYLADSIKLEDVDWARTGTLSFLMRMEGIEDSRVMDLGKGEYNGVKFLRGPAFDLHLYFTNKGAGGLGVITNTADGEIKRYNAPLIHLFGSKTYRITLTWDLDQHKFGVYYNGISQGDIAHWGKDNPELILKQENPTILTSPFSATPEVKLWLSDVSLTSTIASTESIEADPMLATIPPLIDEGRITYDNEPMDLSDYTLEPIYEVDFTDPQTIILETALFDGETRVREPEPTETWILEGPEGMLYETTDTGLRLETPTPEDRANGHFVMWLNKIFPEDYLVEYSFTPRTDRQGLNILFFSAHNPNGDSIFDLDLPYRGGNFGKYIIDAINSYHISPWATDGQSLRATSNMRKNSGFHMVARGNDVIGGSGPGPHTVRILKVGNQVRMEANGVLCLAFDDDGETYGPVYGEGNIGLRFMAHTGHVTVHSLKVYSLDTE